MVLAEWRILKSLLIAKRMGALLAAYGSIRAALLLATTSPGVLPDTPMYLRVPGGSALSQVSLVGSWPRPWVVTLPFGAIDNLEAIVAFQVALSTVAWCALLLAVGLSRCFTKRWRRGLIALLAVLSITSLGTAWDPLIQSDSIALSGALLITAGSIAAVGRQQLPVTASVLLTVGVLTGGSIRVVLVTIAVIAGAIIVWRCPRTLVRSSRLLFVTLGGLALVTAYTTALQPAMDHAWGAYFAGDRTVNGRVLQQMVVIDMVPWGREKTVKIITAGNYPCLEQQFQIGFPWWNQLVNACPSEARRFSNSYQLQFALSLASNPAETARDLWPPVRDSYSALSIPYPQVPGSFNAQIAAVHLGRASSVGIAFVFGILGIALGIARGSITKRQAAAQAQFLILALTALAGVGLTAAFSPLDTARVASAPAAACIVFVLCFAASAWSRIPQRIDPRGDCSKQRPSASG